MKGGCRKKKPSYRKWWWLLAVAAVLAAVIMAVGKINKGEMPQESAPQENMPGEVETTMYTIGDTVKIGDVTITLDSVKEFNDSKFHQPAEGNKFLIFEFTIKNKSKNEIIVSSMMNFSAYADGNQLKQANMSAKETDGKNQLDGALAGGKSMTGTVSYEVPIEYKEAQVHYKPTTNAAEHVIFSYTK